MSMGGHDGFRRVSDYGLGVARQVERNEQHTMACVLDNESLDPPSAKST